MPFIFVFFFFLFFLLLLFHLSLRSYFSTGLLAYLRSHILWRIIVYCVCTRTSEQHTCMSEMTRVSFYHLLYRVVNWCRHRCDSMCVWIEWVSAPDPIPYVMCYRTLAYAGWLATNVRPDLNVREYFDLKRSLRFCIEHCIYIKSTVDRQFYCLFYSCLLLLCTTELRVNVWS